MSKKQNEFVRPYASVLEKRLGEPRRFIQVVAGPRQVGKTTLVRQVLERSYPDARYASADEPALKNSAWIEAQWEAARMLAGEAGRTGAVLALDEIQKMPGWSEKVKRLWDEDTASRLPLKVVILGSAPLLVKYGLTESLAGRFEIIHMPHWSFLEMREAFGMTLEEYIFFGAYPGSAPLVSDPERWARYVRDALIETTISRDVLLMTKVDKPALLRGVFDLGCRYSGQVLSYNKMLGQLQDAGNTTTIAHYLELLGGAGMLTGLQKYSDAPVRRRGSSPKLQVLNNALITAQAGRLPGDVNADPEYRGRLVESAVGVHLANAAASGPGAGSGSGSKPGAGSGAGSGPLELFYWRDRNREVDFVVKSRRGLFCVEVKSSRRRDTLPGLAAFVEAHPGARPLLVGGDGIGLEEFLGSPAERFF